MYEKGVYSCIEKNLINKVFLIYEIESTLDHVYVLKNKRMIRFQFLLSQFTNSTVFTTINSVNRTNVTK